MPFAVREMLRRIDLRSPSENFEAVGRSRSLPGSENQSAKPIRYCSAFVFQAYRYSTPIRRAQGVDRRSDVWLPKRFSTPCYAGLGAAACSGSELPETAMQGPLDEPSVQSFSMHCNAYQPDGLRPLPASQCMSQMWPERLNPATRYGDDS